MAQFTCIGCGARGDLATLLQAMCCFRCGSEDLRMITTIDDYPKGHPFWDELIGDDSRNETPGNTRK